MEIIIFRSEFSITLYISHVPFSQLVCAIAMMAQRNECTVHPPYPKRHFHCAWRVREAHILSCSSGSIGPAAQAFLYRLDTVSGSCDATTAFRALLATRISKGNARIMLTARPPATAPHSKNTIPSTPRRPSNAPGSKVSTSPVSPNVNALLPPELVSATTHLATAPPLSR